MDDATLAKLPGALRAKLDAVAHEAVFAAAAPLRAPRGWPAIVLGILTALITISASLEPPQHAAGWAAIGLVWVLLIEQVRSYYAQRRFYRVYCLARDLVDFYRLTP